MEIPDSEPVPEKATPTENDRQNAEMRQGIADKMRAEYEHCLGMALDALGEGYIPWMKLTLIESDYHRKKGAPVIGGTVYKVYQGEKRLTENSVYLMETDGEVLQAKTYEELFGDLLHEKHPTYGFEHKGVRVFYDRWSLTWGALELYEPLSPERLAALRQTRTENKKKRADAKWLQDNPLLASASYTPEDFPPIKKGKPKKKA